MLTPVRRVYEFPGRYVATTDLYKLDWEDIPESTSEVITDCVIACVSGTTQVSQTITASNATVFRLSGGSARPSIHRFTATFTSSAGETDVLEFIVPVLG